MSKLEELEKEYRLAEQASKRVEKLRQKANEYFENRKDLMRIIEEQEKQFLAHLEVEEKFLKSLPEKVQARIEKDKAVLALRKEVLEMLKPSE